MEALLVALIALAAGFLVWRARPAGVGPRLAAGALMVVAVSTAGAAFGWRARPREVSTARPLVQTDEGYVGSASCRSCHPEEHATWRESFHRTMSQLATRDSVVARFERLDLDWFGKPVRLEWRGDTLWTEFERGGARPGPVRRPIEQLTGSHHLQVLWYSTGEGRELAPLPMVYKLAERLWLPLTAVFVLPPEVRDPPEPGAWNQSCQQCHATNVRPRVDTDRCDTHVGELGIGCESCHGPGAEHVAANQNPVRRYRQREAAAGDPTIVQPQRLSRPRSAQVCGQCHSVNVLREAHVDRWREHGLVYRSGADLDDSTLVVDASDQAAPDLARSLRRNPGFFRSAFWSDGEVRISGREFNGLRRSPCYTHGQGDRQLDCSSCHEMHRAADTDAAAWLDDQLLPGKRTNEACTQCHPALQEPAALVAHTHHAAESPGSLCYNCHMPHTTFGLMKAMRSHTITSPSVAAELATGRPNACNLCHLDRTLQWTAERLQAFYGGPSVALDPDQTEVAAGVRWLLTGDAGQRALAAWSFGWAEAQQTAGTDWLAPYLARLLDDPYYVVRFGAARSLRSLPGGTPALAGYDFLADRSATRDYGERVQRAWQGEYRGVARPPLLLDAQGIVGESFARLYARRDDRPVYLSE